MSKRPEKTWREEVKAREPINPRYTNNQCEFYRDFKRCYFKDLEFCRHEGNKNICSIYRIEVMGLRK